MRNPSILFALCCILRVCPPVTGQVTLQADGRVHYNITSYNGFQTTETQGHKVQIMLTNQAINLPGWSLKARVNAPFIPNVPNVSGQPFPPEKVRLRFTQEQFNGQLSSPAPSLAAVGATFSGIPFNSPGTETPLITNSPVPLKVPANSHLAILYYFGIDIEGGAYLNGMLSDNGNNPWNSMPALYQSSITFLLYDAANREIATATVPLNIQVHRPLTDTPVSAPSYGIEVLGEARSGTLHIHSPSNYLHGTTVTYPGALKVSSETAFEVKVKSLSPELVSPEAYTLPVSTVGVRLSPGMGQSSASTFFPIALGTDYQVLLSSGSGTSGSQLFDIHYFTNGNDVRLLNANAGVYTALLIYQLTPR